MPTDPWLETGEMSSYGAFNLPMDHLRFPIFGYVCRSGMLGLVGWWPLAMALTAAEGAAAEGAAAEVPAVAPSVTAQIAAAEAAVPADELRESGNPARALALTKIAAQQFSAEDQILLTIALAEAWIDARDSVQAGESLQRIPAPVPPGLAERVGLARIALWRIRRQQDQDPGDPVALIGSEASPALRARALAARAEAALALGKADGLADLDAAIQVLADPASAALRRPLLALRITAMEALGADQAQVEAWLTNRKDDPLAEEFFKLLPDSKGKEREGKNAGGKAAEGKKAKPSAGGNDPNKAQDRAIQSGSATEPP